MRTPCPGVSDLLGGTQSVPAQQTRLPAALLLLRRVRLPPRLAARGGVDTACPIPRCQTTFEGRLLGHAGGIKPLGEHLQPRAPLFGRQAAPPPGLTLAQFLVSGLAFGFPPAAVPAAPGSALSGDVLAQRRVVVVRWSG